jgi:hypothetical protein
VSTFVLVPGAWLGAWAWDAVAADLRRGGHDVRPVTLAGLAERAGEATLETNLTTQVHGGTRRQRGFLRPRRIDLEAQRALDIVRDDEVGQHHSF